MHRSGLPMLNRIFLRTHHFRGPDEQELAAYVNQQLIGAERERVESHLAKCDSCLQQVGFLVRRAQGAAAAPVPAWLLARAKAIDSAGQKSSPVRWQWAGAAAAMAMVVISVALWPGRRAIRPDEPPFPIATAQQRPAPGLSGNPNAEASVRGRSPDASRPLVLSPRPGATIYASDFTIRWEPISNAVAYEVRVVTADGSLVWHKRVREASVTPPARILRAGRKYFVWVRALLPDGDTQLSPAVNFIGG